MVSSDLIDRIPTLRELPAVAKADLAEVMREVRYPKGRPIYPLLKPPQEIVAILEGLAKMTGISVNGIERIIYVYRPGEIIGSRVLLPSHEGSYEVTAVRPVRGLAVSRSDYLAVGRRHPDILMAVTAEFSRRLDLMTRRVLAAMSVEVPVRLSQLLLDFASPEGIGDEAGFVPLAYSLTHETMAQIIGASRPHTSTVLRDLEQMGVVKRRSRRGLLVNRARLAGILQTEGLEPVR